MQKLSRGEISGREDNIVVDFDTCRVVDSMSSNTHIRDYTLVRRTDFLSDSELTGIEIEKLNRRMK